MQVTNFSQNGREIAFRDVKAGGSFGKLAAIDGAPRSANVIALKRSQLGTLDVDRFHAGLQRYPAMLDATLRKLVGYVRSLSERVAKMSKPVAVRVAHELERMALKIQSRRRTGVDQSAAQQQHDRHPHQHAAGSGIARDLGPGEGRPDP